MAERLKYRYFDSEVISRAAGEANVSPVDILEAEHVPPLVERILARLGAGAVVDTELASPGAAGMSTAIRNLQFQHYRSFIEHVVRELADQSKAVIVGHAGQIVLQERSSVLKVLISGSASRRAQRLMDDEHLIEIEARRLIEQSDRDRTEFFKTVYRVDLLNSALYDLCIRTDTIPLDGAVELVLNAAASLQGFFPEPEQEMKGAGPAEVT